MTIYTYVAAFLLLLLVKPFRVVAGVFVGTVMAIIGFVLALITAFFSFTSTVINDMSKFLLEGH